MKRYMVVLAVVVSVIELQASNSLFDNAQHVYKMLHPQLPEKELRKDVQSLFNGVVFTRTGEDDSRFMMLNNGMDRAYCFNMYMGLRRLQKEILQSKKHTSFHPVERMKLSPDVEFQENFLEYYCGAQQTITIHSIVQDMALIYSTIAMMDRLPQRIATKFFIPARVHVAILGLLHRALEDLYNRTYSFKPVVYSQPPRYKKPRKQPTQMVASEHRTVRDY